MSGFRLHQATRAGSILAAALLSGAALAQNLLANGDFSSSLEFVPEFDWVPALPDAWTVISSNSDQTAGGDWAQNAAFVTSSADYGDYAVPAGPVLAVYNLGGALQSFDAGAGGNFRLSWQDAAPLAGDRKGRYMISEPEVRMLNVGVWLDGTRQVASFADAIGQDFVGRSVNLSLPPGTHTLEFRGLDAGEIIRFGGANQYAVQSVVHVALLDNVAIVPVPQPGTVPTLLLGLALIAGVMRRRGA